MCLNYSKRNVRYIKGEKKSIISSLPQTANKETFFPCIFKKIKPEMLSGWFKWNNVLRNTHSSGETFHWCQDSLCALESLSENWLCFPCVPKRLLVPLWEITLRITFPVLQGQGASKWLAIHSGCFLFSILLIHGVILYVEASLKTCNILSLNRGGLMSNKMLQAGKGHRFFFNPVADHAFKFLMWPWLCFISGASHGGWGER